MIRLGKVSQETRGVIMPGWIEDRIWCPPAAPFPVSSAAIDAGARRHGPMYAAAIENSSLPPRHARCGPSVWRAGASESASG